MRRRDLELRWAELARRSVEVPEDLRCPIALDLMLEPVLGSDDVFYDKPAAERLVLQHILGAQQRGVNGKVLTSFKLDDDKRQAVIKFIEGQELEKNIMASEVKEVQMESFAGGASGVSLGGPVSRRSKMAVFEHNASQGLGQNVVAGAMVTGALVSTPFWLLGSAVSQDKSALKGGAAGVVINPFFMLAFGLGAIPGLVLGGFFAPAKIAFLATTRKMKYDPMLVEVLFLRLNDVLCMEQAPQVEVPVVEEGEEENGDAEASADSALHYLLNKAALISYNEDFIGFNRDQLESLFSEIIGVYRVHTDQVFSTSSESSKKLMVILQNPCVSTQEKLSRLICYMTHKEPKAMMLYNANKALYNIICEQFSKADLQISQEDMQRLVALHPVPEEEEGAVAAATTLAASS